MNRTAPAQPLRMIAGSLNSWLVPVAWGGLAFFLPGESLMAATNTATNTAAFPPILHDIKGPIIIDSPWAWLGRVAIILILAGLIALAWWWWRRQHPPTEDAVTGISPVERARQRLRAALALIEQPGRFVTEVSETARTYLEERFGLHAPERTTEEFLAELSTSVALDSRHKRLLADFLTECDLVKFARATADRPELEALHDAAQRLVDETAPAESGISPAPPALNESVRQP